LRLQCILTASVTMKTSEESDDRIEQWKVRRLISALDQARGHGTSAITLIIGAGCDINRSNKMLTEELSAGTNVKSKENRLSVLSALTSTQQRLKRYNRIPDNGLIIFCGEMLMDDKVKKVTFDIVPFKPIHKSLYKCDNKFHTEALAELLGCDSKFGFLIIDGNGTLYGTVKGSNREVLHKFSVDLPKKHGRGGQSALRFARLRLEKRRNYLRKVGELATQFFIADDKPNIKGLIVAGSADFKLALVKSSDLFDPRLSAVLVPPLLDISYGGEAGFDQAIELAADTLKNVRFIEEKQLVSSFLAEVAQDTGRYCFGINDTIQGLEMGAVSTLILWENLEMKRLRLRNQHTDVENVLHVTLEEAKNEQLYRCAETGAELMVLEHDDFIDWMVENYKTFGTTLEFITDKSQEGNQFCKGFGGIGGLLRYRV